MKGRFITLEGGEGVGKSTQSRALADSIAERGYRALLSREPGGSAGAEAIRDLLMTGGADRWSARSEALLFAAARADHVERTIRPALERGEWVICDRFIDSSRAYQGGAGGLADEDLLTLHRIGSEGLMPDRTLVLVLDPDEAMARAVTRDGAAADRFARQGHDYHQRVADAFRALAASEPARLRLVSASGSRDEVTSRLVAEIEDLL